MTVWPVTAEVAEDVVREGMVVDGARVREGGAHPSRCPAWKVRGLRFVGEGERMVVLGRKGRGTTPSLPIPGIEWLYYLRGR